MVKGNEIKRGISTALKANGYDRFVEFKVVKETVGHVIEYWFINEKQDDATENRIMDTLRDAAHNYEYVFTKRLW